MSHPIMAQRLSRSSPYLRLALDASSRSRACRQCHRGFSATAARGANPRMNIKRPDGPARPSMETAQRMQTKNLRREDLPEEMGMLRITYILPPGPSIFKDPRLRGGQLYEFTKQYGMEILQSVISKLFFWRGIAPSRRPKSLPKPLLPILPPKIPLQTLSHKRIIKDLHTRSYRAIQHAVETGDMRGIKETCGTSLQEHYARLVQNYAAKREVVKWEVRYKPWPVGVRILSRKFGQIPFEFEGLPLGAQQVVARIKSTQTLTPGRIVGRTKDGGADIAWGEPKSKELTEHVIMSRKYIKGEFEPWKIFGFQSPKGTAEELEKWREEQMRIPGQPEQQQQRRGAGVAA